MKIGDKVWYYPTGMDRAYINNTARKPKGLPIIEAGERVVAEVEEVISDDQLDLLVEGLVESPWNQTLIHRGDGPGYWAPMEGAPT